MHQMLRLVPIGRALGGDKMKRWRLPSTSEPREASAGVVGTLTRTNTFGIDKKISQLLIFVSNQAWVEVPWLEAGLDLWQGRLVSKRDCFLPLPSNFRIDPDAASPIH